MKQQEAAKSATETTTSPRDRHVALRSSISSLVASTSSQIIAYTPSLEDSVKVSGGAVAALLTMRYAGSLRSACLIGLLSGLFSHSLYADVLRKKKRRRGEMRQEKREREEEEEDGENERKTRQQEGSSGNQRDGLSGERDGRGCKQ